MENEELDSEGGMALNICMKVYCPQHKEQVKKLGLNETYMANALMSAGMEKIFENVEEGAGMQDAANVLNGHAESGVPFCCLVGQDRFDQIVADAPPSSGDEFRDRLDAAFAVPGVRPVDENSKDVPKEVFDALKRLRFGDDEDEGEGK